MSKKHETFAQKWAKVEAAAERIEAALGEERGE